MAADTSAGLDEMLRRRVGRNELSVIQVCLAYLQAQNEYSSLDPAGLGRGVYDSADCESSGKKRRALLAERRRRSVQPAWRALCKGCSRGL